jgi:hypothetical protein
MGDLAPVASRHGLLQVAVPAPVIETLASLHKRFGDGPAEIQRTAGGRQLSRARYQRAEEFLPRAPDCDDPDHAFLYRAGICAQLGLSSYLLDIGFDDLWCAHHIGLRVAHALAYANATGLGHDDADMARLAVVLTPYWKWNVPAGYREAVLDDGGFVPDQVRSLLRALLDQIRLVTGHPARRRRAICGEAMR